jgi:hypothetical protein
MRADPATRTLYRVRYRCGCFREGCPICLGDRIDELQNTLRRAKGQAEGEVVAISLSRRQATKFVRRLRDHDIPYRRLPTESADYIFFDSSGAEGCYSEEELIDFSTLSLETLALTPDNRRMSGKLGAYIPPPPPSDCVLITTEQVFFDTGDLSMEECAREAERRVRDYSPTTAEEVQESVDALIQALKDVVGETGGEITYTQEVKEYVSLAKATEKRVSSFNSYIDP